uniref:Uncharacterized protein n=1 Tax=Zea mays TaxID=4577 RepID=A0A804PD57_MAIZE
MPSPCCSPRPHLHGRAAPLQRASPFPSLRSSSAKRRCSCSHDVQVPAPSPPIQKQQPCTKPLPLLLSDARRVLDEMCSSLDGSARCRLAVLLRSEQHAVMPVGGLLFLRSPVVVVERNPVFCVEKASRSTLVDVRSYAQIGIAIVLTNIDWVCLWTER